MAYKKVAEILKSKDPTKPDYLKITEDITLKKGDFLNLESKKSRLASLEKAVENGKLSEEVAGKIREGIEKTPEFVRFQVTIKD